MKRVVTFGLIPKPFSTKPRSECVPCSTAVPLWLSRLGFDSVDNLRALKAGPLRLGKAVMGGDGRWCGDGERQTNCLEISKEPHCFLWTRKYDRLGPLAETPIDVWHDCHFETNQDYRLYIGLRRPTE